jgi:arachidonate 5-lipoxygenase
MLLILFQEAERAKSSFVGALSLKVQSALLTGARDSIPRGQVQDCHPISVGGVGFVAVVSNPKFPEHEFFKTRRTFRMRIRHCNFSFEDDAMLDGRVTCLKLADQETGGPLDLTFYTGRVSQFWNVPTYKNFLDVYSKGSDQKFKEYLLQSPIQ